MPGNREAFSAAINAADRHRWDSHWPEAMQEYQRALAEFPDEPVARSGLGFCYMQTKQWQRALEEYEYVLQRDPGNVIALSKTAELYGILNRRGDASRPICTWRTSMRRPVRVRGPRPPGRKRCSCRLTMRSHTSDWQTTILRRKISLL